MAKIDVELADGSKAGETLKALTKQASNLRKEIAGLKPGTEDFTKKAQALGQVTDLVDGMKSEITAAQQSLKKLSETEQDISTLKEQIQSTQKASGELKGAFGGILNQIPGFADGKDLMNKFSTSVGGLSGGFKNLRLAIASTGIGLLIVALASLISYFTSTQEGMDKLSSVTRPLKAVFEALKGVIQELGGKVFKTLSEAVKNPMQALKDLGQVLLDNVINRFKAFALIGPAIAKIFSKDWKEGLKDLGNAALQVATGVENVIDKIADTGKAIAQIADEAYKKGQRINELQIQIEKAELAQITRSKQIELSLKQQKDIVEDVTKSWDERREAAQRALQLQQESLNMELSLLDKRIEKMKLEQSLNDTSREQQKELAELEAKKLELQAQATEQSIEWKKKITEFDKAQAAEQLAILQNLQALRLEAMNEGLAKEIAAIEQSTQQKIAALTGSETQIAEQRKLLQEISERQIQEVKDKFAKEEEEKRKARIEKQLKNIEDAGRDEQLALLEQLAERNLSAEEYDEELYELQVQSYENQLALLEREGEAQSEAYQQIYSNLLKLNIDHNNKIEQQDRERFDGAIQAAAELTAAITEGYQAEIDAQQAKVDRAKELYGEDSAEYKKEQDKLAKIKKEQGEKQKRLERVQVGLNLLAEISSIWKGAASLGPIAGPITGAVLTAAAIIRANAALKNIDSQQFAKGGEIRGPAHSQGGVPFTVDGKPGFEAEGGEVIINKRSAAHFRRDLSAINAFNGWGRKFETGGPVSPWNGQVRFADGGYTRAVYVDGAVPGSISLNMLQALKSIDNNIVTLGEDFSEYAKSNNNRIDRIQVNINLQEVEEGLNTLNSIKSEADV